MRLLLVIVFLALPLDVSAQSKTFIGAVGGVSTLSADGSFTNRGGTSAHAQYKPENGPTVMVFAGRHLHDYFSVQVSYSWNRNTSILSATELGTVPTSYEQHRRNTQHTVIGEGMIYFRNLESRVRPYLSVGAGIHHFSSTATRTAQVIGDPVQPPAKVTETGPAFRVAVGIDLHLKRNLAFRYSFSETIQGNPLSKQLRPEGNRNLANFQNLFGFAWYF